MVDRSSPVSALADELQKLCCAETEGKFFDCVTDNIGTIIKTLRAVGLAQCQQEPVAYRWRQPGSKHWIYDPTPEWIEEHKHEIELEPLFTNDAQPSAGSASAGYVLVPRELTADNGAKSALIGEFSETFDYMDDEGDECQAEIPVSWTTIKAIHKKMVERFGVEPSSAPAQPPKLWPDIKELHDVIAGHIERRGLTYSSIRAAAENVQKLYASTLSPTDQPVCSRCDGKGYITKPHPDGAWYTADCPTCTVSSTDRQCDDCDNRGCELFGCALSSPVRPCAGCDGHECDNGCAYPGAQSSSEGSK